MVVWDGSTTFDPPQHVEEYEIERHQQAQHYYRKTTSRCPGSESPRPGTGMCAELHTKGADDMARGKIVRGRQSQRAAVAGDSLAGIHRCGQGPVGLRADITRLNSAPFAPAFHTSGQPALWKSRHAGGGIR